MSYSNNPRSIVAGTGIVVSPTTGTGSNVVTITANGLALEPVRVALVSPDTVLATDSIVSYQLTVPGAVAVALPAGITGTVYYLKDGTGDAATNPITITPNGAETIDDAATATINTNYGAITIAYTGAKWEIL
jgi:hypothetical protein